MLWARSMQGGSCKFLKIWDGTAVVRYFMQIDRKCLILTERYCILDIVYEREAGEKMYRVSCNQ